jgi:tetratricopeptide (TPR) repeat protein
MLNDMGVFLNEESLSPRRHPQHSHIGLAFFSGASALGCEASCISVFSAFQTSRDTSMLFTPLFKPTLARFREIINGTKNPYAMALDGENHRRTGRFNAAIRCLERALQLGGPDFQWGPTCEYRLGLAYKGLGDYTKAQPLIEKAAAAGVPESWFQLAELSPVGSQERMEAGYKAGCLGEPLAFADLADELDSHAGKDGLTPEEREDLLHFSAEAKRLARYDVPY